MLTLMILAGFLGLAGAIGVLESDTLPHHRRRLRAGTRALHRGWTRARHIQFPLAAWIRARVPAPTDTGRIALRVLVGAGLVCLPATLAHLFHGHTAFDTTDAGRAADHRIAALLADPRLGPPPALPPDIFAALEVEAIHPAAREANRDWSLLEPAFRQRLLAAFELMRRRHGYEMVLIEGYRSPARQAQLASLGPGVTRADAHQSYHQYGLAADCAFLRQDRLVISERDPWAMRGYALLGQIAADLGLTWGGQWTLRDYGHLELRPTAPEAPATTASSAPLRPST